MANPVSNLVGVVGKILGDVRTHRVATAVVAILVGTIGLIETNGTDLGLDPETTATIVGGIGVLVAIAREFAKPVFIPVILALFGVSLSAKDEETLSK